MARAQEAPATEFTLAYKYQAGTVQQFRLDTKSDLTLTPEGAGGIGPLPITSKMVTAYSEKVAGAREGTGTITVTVNSMLIDTNALGMASVIKMQNGKITSTVNGQPAPEGAGGLGAARGLIATRPVTLKRDARGATVDNGGSPVANTGVGANVAQLPDHPVKVGDSWDVVQKVRANLPGGPGGEAAPEIEVKFTHTLKEVLNAGGKQFAMIESIGTGSTPMDAPGPSVTQNVTGTTRFDIARGAVASGKYNLDLSMKLATPGLPGGAVGGGGSPTSVRVDGIIEMTLAEVPAAAAGKKPAPKKPVRKSTRKR
jgi:hypothetical protein